MDNSLEHITALKTRPLVPNSTTDSGENGGPSLLAAWKAVGQASTHAKQQNSVFYFWWSTAAYLLAVLLDQAGYSNESQYRNLQFFADFIVPELGLPPSSSPTSSSKWRSFMTDDGTPVEFSWDWGWRGDGQSSIVRFSIEPIGREAGSQTDPLNAYAGISLISRLAQSLPDINLEWFNHFSDRFLTFKSDKNPDNSTSICEGHQSQIFVAFDLHADCILVKVYFFPAFKSVQLGISKLDLVSQSIDHLNARNGLQLGAFDLLKHYIIYSPHRNIDVEMLAFDCISPARSRLKIYVRSPYTSFDSVQEILTLGDKRRRVQMSSSLEKLHELWDLVTDDGRPKSASEELKQVAHRTAGILYNFEIKHGKREPVPKVYIPVRHYGENDLSVLRGLRSWLQKRSLDWAGGNYSSALLYLL